MIKAVVFDFDQTLSNRYENAYRVFDPYLRQFFPNVSDIEYEAILQDMLTFDNCAAYGVETRCIPFLAKYKNLPEDFVPSFKKYYYDHMGEFAVLREDTIKTLEALKGKYKLGIITNGDAKSQHQKIDHVNISNYFDSIIVSGDYDFKKPDVRIYQTMADSLGLKCEECVYVGDIFSGDIKGAIDSNMVPAWIKFKGMPSKYYDGIVINDIYEIVDEVEKLNKK